MAHHVNPKNGDAAPLVDEKVYDIIMQVWAGAAACASCTTWHMLPPCSHFGLHSSRLPVPAGCRALHRRTPAPGSCLPAPQHASRLDSEIVYDRDFDYDYFGFKVW